MYISRVLIYLLKLNCHGELPINDTLHMANRSGVWRSTQCALSHFMGALQMGATKAPFQKKGPLGGLGKCVADRP